jgi:hypothetical protein
MIVPMGTSSNAYFPLGYYFTKVASFPADLPPITFPTALRAFSEQQSLSTSIKPIRIPQLPKAFVAFEVTTYTEYFSKVYAGSEWHNEFLRETVFTGFLWPAEDIFIAATSFDVVKAFVRSAREKSSGRIYLQSLRVNIDGLIGVTSRGTRAISLEHDLDSGGPHHVKRLSAAGRDVQESPEVQHYRQGGAIGSGLEFNYPYEGLEFPLWVTRDGSIRLNRHVGESGDPNIQLELAIVTDCWKQRVEKFYEVKSLVRPAKVVSRPGPVQGQQALDLPLKP